ncbi:S-adenosyl-L-methionine-dependent methyltransferase [Lentinula aciculospora]|uniref:S-adenosyl-L-methionine-dependent methyltransferase n=1 Tax=Lentinula aciculospora TaxID=153920 RepID=A0A9W8ZY34_9AGAR|nr:S-adenosyl-L-methionine-dependent methyltransferase [Lentinula aciculospora]
MSTFAKSSFNAAVYAASRPTYPKALFQLIFNYHEKGAAALPDTSNITSTGSNSSLRPRWNTAVDLGCGTGQATTELHPFQRVIGVDPSEGMVQRAREHVEGALGSEKTSQFSFVQSSAEKLEFLENESVDLIIAAQAAHWFDWDKQWPEIARILRPSGTVAFWTYSEFRLPQYPSLTPLITHYLQGKDPDTSLGPYWERPGRTILERHLVDVPEPKQALGQSGIMTDTDRVYFSGPYHETSPTNSPSLNAPVTLPIILRSQSTWNGLLGYFHTFSSLHNYIEKHPDDAQKHGGKTLAERTWMELMEGAEKEEQERKQLEGAVEKDKLGKEVKIKGEDELVVEWPVAMVLAKKL